ncbi:hypothetical protein H2198_006242 [Neophaeococcomyces mojaviensis]|uniref:Uncharacterized protein n=1 Tax=Neophaeococcomyces mojaviensis TaxID=3383035 RepID=A0ACC3A3Z3_9EURO|nr:hypothetical protein H2198_006242 [Knufia sp. JES_112]
MRGINIWSQKGGLGSLVVLREPRNEPEYHLHFRCEDCGVVVWIRTSVPRRNALHFQVNTSRRAHPPSDDMTQEAFEALSNDLTTLMDLRYAVGCPECHTVYSLATCPDTENSIHGSVVKSPETWEMQPEMMWYVPSEIAWVLSKRAGVHAFSMKTGDNVGFSSLREREPSFRYRALRWAKRRYEGARMLYKSETQSTWKTWLTQTFPDSEDIPLFDDEDGEPASILNDCDYDDDLQEF